MRSLLLLLFLISLPLFGQQNYFDLKDEKRIDKGLQSKDPYGINEPLSYEGETEMLEPYQGIWRPSVPYGRMPTSDQQTIAPYNLDKPGIMRDW